MTPAPQVITTDQLHTELFNLALDHITDLQDDEVKAVIATMKVIERLATRYGK